MKEKQFIKKLLNKLDLLTENQKNNVISYYKNNIKERTSNGEKVKDIINSYGDLNILADKIIKEHQKGKFFVFIKNQSSKIVSKTLDLKRKIKQIIEKDKKKKKTLKKKKRRTKFNKLNSKKSKKILNLKKKNVNKKEESTTINEIEKDIMPKKRSILKEILVYILIILFFVNTTIFFIMIIGFLDGIKIIGLLLSFGMLSIIYLLIIFVLDGYYHFNKLNKNIRLTIFIVVILLFSCGIALSINEVYSLNHLKNPKDFYTMDTEKYDVVINKKITNYNIYFNSFYKNNYDLVIDESLGNKIRVEVKYYECLNDLYFKKSDNSLYISLSEGTRDVMSFYINNLRNGTIMDYKELSRYEIIIKMSSAMKKIVKIHS